MPGIVALAGWIYIFQGSGWPAIKIMLVWTGLGVPAFLIWARIEHTWPFGPKLIRERFLEEQRAEAAWPPARGSGGAAGGQTET